MGWEEYNNKISMINWFGFMTNLSIENHKNTIAKMRRGDKYEL
jgi:hypothetical protein|tara:strand:- start:413 stop:541 length:129 start_codon:yes stop_codon:yes gene_type:complete